MNRYLIALFIFCCQYCFATYYSQFGQDRYINEEIFKDYQGGIFVEIGAHNGMTYSNTYFLEKERDWKGICIEPIPERFAELKACRNCVCIEGCVSDINEMSQLLMISCPEVNTEMLSGLLHKYDPRHLERVKNEICAYKGSCKTIDVQCYKLNDLFENNGITHVNYLSIDTEGGEFDILSSVDFSKFTIDVITVEDNYCDPRFITFLEEKGFKFDRRICCDLLFIRKDFPLD